MGPGLPERIREGILDLLYPRLTCPVCGCFGEGLCPECGSRLRKTQTPEAESGADECRIGASLYHHDEVTTKLINRYKLKSGFNALHVMERSLTEDYRTYIASFDMVTFAPSSRASLKRLGFDHGFLLAKAVSRRSGVPLRPLFSPPEMEQKQLDREERKENVRTITFLECVVVKGKVPAVKGKRVLIVDDVLTTGSTVDFCSELIRREGGEAEHLTFSQV